MASFHWRPEEYVKFNSILRVLNGLTGVAFCLTFIFGYMQKKITPRQGIVMGLLSQLIFFLITYPWSFLSKKMSYEVLGVNGNFFTKCVSYIILELNKTIVIQPGCQKSMEWCELTSSINIPIYCAAEIIFIGIALPMIHLNLEILYSTVLGRIKQGTMQGVFIVSGDLLHVLGPIILA